MKKEIYKQLTKNNSFLNILSFESQFDDLDYALREVILTYCEMNPGKCVYDVDNQIQRALLNNRNHFKWKFEVTFPEREKWYRKRIGKSNLFDD